MPSRLVLLVPASVIACSAGKVGEPNQPPVVEGVEIASAPDPTTTASSLTCTGEASDPDGDDLTPSITWTLGADGDLLGATATLALSADAVSPGDEIHCTYVVTDPEGAQATASAHVVVGNQDPAMDPPAIRVDGDAVYNDSTLTCTTTAADPDEQDVTIGYQWDNDTTGARLGEASVLLLTPATATPGDALTCTATVTDTDGATTHATAGVTVDNRNPTAVSVSVTPAEARVGDTLTCLMTATDADADPLEMRYAWPDGAVGETYTIAETDDPGDTILCTAMAEDPHGGRVEATAATTVRNTAPTIDSVAIRPDPATNDDTLVCAATATDADGDAPTITHAWAGGSAGSLGTGDTLDLSTTAAASLETVTCTATASDPDGGSAADTADLTLSNRDPSVSVALSPATGAARGDTLTCTATATDADGDATTTHFGWTVDGGTTASTTDSATNSTLSGAFSKNERVACTATSDDGKGGTATASAATTIVNTPPTAPAVAIDPSDPVVGEPLVCMVSTPSTDVDGDGISYTMTWTVDGTAFGAAADTGDTGLGDDLLDTTTWTGDTVPAGVTLDGEVWACTATPDDGDDEGATGTDSATVEEPVCWSRTYSASLASSPSGITSVNGAWGGHAYVSMGGRSCLRQNSDWNYSYIPVARSSLDFERIEIDVYYPGTGSTSYTMYAFGERYGLNYVSNSLWFSQGTGSADIRHGNTYSANTTLHTFGSPPAPTGTWATLTWVVDRVASTADFYVNGALQASGMAFSPAVLGSSKVVLRAGGVAYRVPPNVCWSNLEVFEAEEDTTCFE